MFDLFFWPYFPVQNQLGQQRELGPSSHHNLGYSVHCPTWFFPLNQKIQSSWLCGEKKLTSCPSSPLPRITHTSEKEQLAGYFPEGTVPWQCTWFACLKEASDNGEEIQKASRKTRDKACLPFSPCTRCHTQGQASSFMAQYKLVPWEPGQAWLPWACPV